MFRNRTPEVEKELLLLRPENNKLSADRAAHSLTKAEPNILRAWWKTIKLLAWQIKQLETRKNNSDTITDPAEINNEFRKYYINL